MIFISCPFVRHICSIFLYVYRIKKVYFGCANDRFGGCGSILSLHADGEHRFEVSQGLLASEAVDLFREFYERGNALAPPEKRRRQLQLGSTDEGTVESQGKSE